MALTFDELNDELDSPESLSSTLQRPVVTLPTGESATVRSIGVGDDRGEWVIPTIVGGKSLSNDEAISLWRKGKNQPLGGPFDSVDKATDFAQRFHEAEAKRIAPKSFSFDDLNEEIAGSNSFSFDDLNKELEYTAPTFDAASAQQPVLTEEEKATAAAPWYRPPSEWSKPFGGVTEIPSGANTRFPALTIPLSSLGKAAGGMVDYFTSPQGITEGLGMFTPAAPVVALKWAVDMIKGGKESVENIGHTLASSLGGAITKGTMSANQLGIPTDSTPAQTKEHIQDLSDNIVNAGLMAVGALGAGKTAIAEAKHLPKRFEAFPELPPQPKFRVEDRGQTLADMARRLMEERVTQKEGEVKPAEERPALEVAKEIAQDPDIAFALQSAQEILKRSEESKKAEEPVAAKEAATPEPEARGIIFGTELEKWADQQLKGGGTHLGPDILAAYIVKGAAVIERVGTDFAKWSVEALKELGEDAKPFLQDIFRESQRLHQARTVRQTPQLQTVPNLSAPPTPPTAPPPVQPVAPGPAARPFGRQAGPPPTSTPATAGAPQAAVERSPWDPRARFTNVGRASAPVEKLFTQTVQAGTEARTIVNDFMRRAFGTNRANQERLARDFVSLGWDNRGAEAATRGIAAPAIPRLTPQEAARIRADPQIQEAIRIWNSEVSPRLVDIRTRNQMLMNPNWNQMDLMLNLPAEYDPAFTRRAGVNTGDVFNEPMRGEGALQPEPIEALNQIVRGHLRYDATQQLQNAIRRDVSIPPPPNLAHFPIPPRGERWRLPFRGRNIEVEAIDLAPEHPQGEYHYVPVPVAEAWKKQMQERGQWNNIIDRARGMFISWGVLPGSFMPHVVREIAAVAGRIGQSGQTWWSLAPSWLGSNWKTLHRMFQMRETPYGTLMQNLVDRTGSDRGSGFAPEPTTRLGRIAGFSHEALFNPNWGIDVLARRTIADASLIKRLGLERLRNFERAVNAGQMTPLQAMRWMEQRLGERGMVSIGREVNNTMGYANPQTRAATLNWVQRLLPFISSESGKIPDEIRRLTTLNLSFPSMSSSVRRGEYSQLAKQVAGSLANGPVGVFALMSLINYMNTKAQTGNGVPITDNPQGRKTDIWLAKDWYWSNLDPGLERAARILGAREVLDYGHKPDAGRELINETFSVLAPDIRWLFTVLSDKSLYLGSDKQFMPARASDKVPFSPARDVINAVADEKPIGPAIAKGAAGLMGIQLATKPTDIKVIDAVRLNNIAEDLAQKMRKMPKAERREYFTKQMEKMGIEGGQRNKIRLKLQRHGIFKYEREE